MKNNYKFRANHFYQLLETQDYTCPLSGRKLTPENTTAEHIIPLQAGGVHELSNIYLIHKDVGRIKRHLSEADVVRLAFDILQTNGKKYGFQAKAILKR